MLSRLFTKRNNNFVAKSVKFFVTCNDCNTKRDCERQNKCKKNTNDDSDDETGEPGVGMDMTGEIGYGIKSSVPNINTVNFVNFSSTPRVNKISSNKSSNDNTIVDVSSESTNIFSSNYSSYSSNASDCDCDFGSSDD